MAYPMNVTQMLIILITKEKKFFVINLDKLTYSSNRYHYEKRNGQNYKFIKVDIVNKEKITKIIRKYKPKVIFNANKIPT